MSSALSSDKNQRKANSLSSKSTLSQHHEDQRPQSTMNSGYNAPDISPGLRDPVLPILSGILTSLSVILVCTRYYVRSFLLRRFGWDDFFIGLALVDLP